MQYSQENLKTMVYAEFGGQTECIMGNSKIENLNLTEITKFKYERKNEKDSGNSTKMTPSGKWPIGSTAKTTAVHVHHSF